MIVMPDADLDQAVDALIGAGYGSAGERCMAISVAIPVGEDTADALVARLKERICSLRIGRSDDPEADFGPLVGRDAVDRVRRYVDLGVEEGAELVVDGRDFVLPGHENGFFTGASLFDRVTPRCASTRRRSSGRSCPWSAPRTTRRPCGCPASTSTEAVSRSSPGTATPPATSPAG